ncbi:hypothetical protein [Peribacillus psychrosaccharolyticus]|uniref:hypothetical protein n=1 Tax=Peribacillus psychrosaccharolyticus TaxID=1407 RepID=UPI0003189280
MAIAGVNQHKKHGAISYISIVIGIVCFFIVFVTPTRLANIGMAGGDYITFALTALGIITSLIGISKKSERNIIPIISLVLSASLFIDWLLFFFLIITGISDFAP